MRARRWPKGSRSTVGLPMVGHRRLEVGRQGSFTAREVGRRRTPGRTPLWQMAAEAATADRRPSASVPNSSKPRPGVAAPVPIHLLEHESHQAPISRSLTAVPEERRRTPPSTGPAARPGADSASPGSPARRRHDHSDRPSPHRAVAPADCIDRPDPLAAEDDPEDTGASRRRAARCPLGGLARAHDSAVAKLAWPATAVLDGVCPDAELDHAPCPNRWRAPGPAASPAVVRPARLAPLEEGADALCPSGPTRARRCAAVCIRPWSTTVRDVADCNLASAGPGAQADVRGRSASAPASAAASATTADQTDERVVCVKDSGRWRTGRAPPAARWRPPHKG